MVDETQDEGEGYMNMEDSQARDIPANDGDEKVQQDGPERKSSEGSGEPVPDSAEQGGGEPGTVGTGTEAPAPATGGSSGDAGGASSGGGSTGEGGGASQGGGTGN